MSPTLSQRYQAMGFIPGAKVVILRDNWPFPLHVSVGSTEYMVRRKDWPTILKAIK